MVRPLLIVISTLSIAFATLPSCKSGPTAADYIVDAQEAVEDGRYEEAETFVKLAADEGAAERDTRILRAKIHRDRAIDALEAEERERAFDEFVRAGEIDPRRATSERYFRKAVEIGEHSGMSASALAPTAQKAVDSDPSSKRARRLAAKLWDESGEREKAIDSYLWLWQSDKADPKIGRRLAALYRHLDRPNDAISVLEDIVDKTPDDAQAALNLAELYVEVGWVERARSLFENLVERYPEKPGILLRYSRFLRDRGDPNRADTLQEKAYEILPGDRRRKMRDLQ